MNPALAIYSLENKAILFPFKVNMKKPRWTDKEIEYVKKHYRKKKTNWKLMLQNVKHTREAIVERAGYLGLSSKQTNWSEEEIENIKSQYQNKKVREIALGNNRTEKAIRRILSEKKIKKKIKWHKYRINHKFFSEWTNESAYVFGLIVSDGCLNSQKNHYSTEITSKDKCLLENVRELMEFTKPVEESRGTFRLRIDNPVIYQDLINKGLTPRKSKTLQFPEMPEDAHSHFIRGFFDGDGSVFKLKDGRVVVKFTCWSPLFLSKLQEVLSQKIGIRNKKNHDNSIVYYPNESPKVLELLYQNSNSKTRLNRKYERYIKYKGD